MLYLWVFLNKYSNVAQCSKILWSCKIWVIYLIDTLIDIKHTWDFSGTRLRYCIALLVENLLNVIKPNSYFPPYVYN